MYIFLFCWDVSLVYRNVNFLSHNLARWTPFCNWMGPFPSPLFLLGFFPLKIEMGWDHSMFPFYIIIIIH